MITKEVYEEQKALSDRWETMYYEKKNELDQLTNNWNELEEYIGKEWYCFDNESVECMVAKNILDKMKEIKENNK